MSKDGPPSSSGYRYGSRAALRAAIPPTAVNAKGDSEARKALAEFSSYPSRVKSIGKPLPKSKGISPERNEVLRKIQEIKQEAPAKHFVLIGDGRHKKLKLFYYGTPKRYFFVQENVRTRVAKRSIVYGSRSRAMQAYQYDQIVWKKDAYPIS